MLLEVVLDQVIMVLVVLAVMVVVEMDLHVLRLLEKMDLQMPVVEAVVEKK